MLGENKPSYCARVGVNVGVMLLVAESVSKVKQRVGQLAEASMVIGGFTVGTACAYNNNHSNSNLDETAGTLLTSSDTPLVAESLDVSRMGFSVSLIHHSLVIPQRHHHCSIFHSFLFIHLFKDDIVYRC